LCIPEYNPELSPRPDFFLSLCLDQARKSPMHYRYGSIIARGGSKVFAMGHTDGKEENGPLDLFVTEHVDEVLMLRQSIMESEV